MTTVLETYGVIRPDGTLELEEKLTHLPGRVKVRVETMVAVEHIVEARYVQPSQLYLRFADGFEGTWSFEQLGLCNLKVETANAGAAGDCVEVRTKDGNDAQLDSPSLRALIDPGYAANLESDIAALSIPSERLESIAEKNQPPQEWYDAIEMP